MTHRFMSRYRNYTVVLTPQWSKMHEDGTRESSKVDRYHFENFVFKTDDDTLAARLHKAMGYGPEFWELPSAARIPAAAGPVVTGSRSTVTAQGPEHAPHACGDCPQTFSNAGGLARHRSVKHDPQRAPVASS